MQRAFALLLLVLCAIISARAEPLQYRQRAGSTTPYGYHFVIIGQMGIGGKGSPTRCIMDARVVDQVIALKKSGLASLQMIVKNGIIDGRSGDNLFTDDIPYTVLAFDRTAAGIISNLRYTTKTAKSTLPIPGFEQMWLLFTRFGHHFQLPSKELQFGDGWSTKETIGFQPGKTMSLQTKNRLVAAKTFNGKRYVQIDSSFQLTAPKQVVPLGDGEKGGKLAMDCSVTGKAYLLFDPKAGEVYRSSFNATVSTKAVVGDGTSTKSPSLTGSFTVRGKVEKADASRRPTAKTW